MSAQYVSKADLDLLLKWGGPPDPFAPKPNAGGEFLIAEQAPDLPDPLTLISGPESIRDAMLARLRVAERGGPATSEEIAAVNRALGEPIVPWTADEIARGWRIDPPGTIIVNGKPTQLAAGQVWARAVGATIQRRTIVRQDPDRDGGWFSEERPGHSTPAMALLTMDEWRYLGTREEVATRERAAIAAMPAIPRMPMPECADIFMRADLFEHAMGEQDRGSRGWFLRHLSKSLGVPPSTITIDESEIGTVAVSVDGYPMGKLAEALDAWRPFLPMHVHIVARHRPAPAPALANGPHPHVAQPRDCRTAGDHAGALAKHVLATPSPRAPRAAASPSLVGWQELPHFWRRWAT